MMVTPTYYVHECPTCGRSVEIRVEFLGREVSCRHCRGQFLATDPASAGPAQLQSGTDLLHRANELLDLVDRNSRFAEAPSPTRSCCAS